MSIKEVYKENDNGAILLTECAEHDLVIINILFRLKNSPQSFLEISAEANHWHLINYVIVRTRDRRDMLYTRSVRGPVECQKEPCLISSITNKKETSKPHSRENDQRRQPQRHQRRPRSPAKTAGISSSSRSFTVDDDHWNSIGTQFQLHVRDLWALRSRNIEAGLAHKQSIEEKRQAFIAYKAFKAPSIQKPSESGIGNVYQKRFFTAKSRKENIIVAAYTLDKL